MFALFAVLFGVMFAAVFLSIILSGWRMSRMVNKVFTLAEQEMDRKLSADSSSDAAAIQSECSHCGSKLTSQVGQCPNCGASVP